MTNTGSTVPADDTPTPATEVITPEHRAETAPQYASEPTPTTAYAPVDQPGAAYATAPTETVVADRVAKWRGFASGVALFAGGYITLSLFSGALIPVLSGSSPAEDYVGFFLMYALIAGVLSAIGILVGPASILRRIIALVVLPVVVTLALIVFYARLMPNFPLRLDPFVGAVLTNPAFAVTFWFLLVFLLVRGRKALSFVFLVLTFAIAPLSYVFAINGLASGVAQPVTHLIALVIIAIVVLLARLVSGRDVERVAVAGYRA